MIPLGVQKFSFLVMYSVRTGLDVRYTKDNYTWMRYKLLNMQAGNSGRLLTFRS